MSIKQKRTFLIVLDSFGVGYLPDASDFGDEGSNTLRSVYKTGHLNVKTMAELGLFNIDGVDFAPSVQHPTGAFARMAEASEGKDTTTGHWEIAGLKSGKMPTFPNGFPDEVIKAFEKETGREVLCNKPYSGTDVIKDYGEEHEKTGNLIVYTSADSVFQIAAHEDIVPLEQLYMFCRIARKILIGKYAVGRVIARPFSGKKGEYFRTENRHDFSIEPPKDTVLDLLSKNQLDVIGVGKISDIFAGRGITTSHHTKNNDEGIKKLLQMAETDFYGLCFVNLVDFDMIYGHRNDVEGYTAALNKFDFALSAFIQKMKEDDVLIITADHGCDPCFKGTDHTREYTPMLLFSKKMTQGINLNTRSTFADISATIAEQFDIDYTETELIGKSFWKKLNIS